MLDRLCGAVSPARGVLSVQDGDYSTQYFLRDLPKQAQVVGRLPKNSPLYEVPVTKATGRPGSLDRALCGHRCEIHHSDQGVQYAATAYIERLGSIRAKISMASVAQAWQNGYAERLMRTIKQEEVERSDYADLADARQEIGHFLESVYQHERIHSSLGYLTPSEFEAVYFKEQSEAKHPP